MIEKEPRAWKKRWRERRERKGRRDERGCMCAYHDITWYTMVIDDMGKIYCKYTD